MEYGFRMVTSGLSAILAKGEMEKNSQLKREENHEAIRCYAVR